MSLNDSKLKSSRAKERPPLATPTESDTPKPATSGHQSSDQDRKSTRLNSSHVKRSRMPSSA